MFALSYEGKYRFGDVGIEGRIILKDVGIVDVGCIHLAQDSD